MTEPYTAPPYPTPRRPGGTWANLLTAIEHDGGPVLPYVPSDRAERRVPAPCNTPLVPVFDPPSPAETLALADELTAAGTPDETFVGDALREALQTAADDIAREAVNTVPQLTFPRPAILPTFAEMCEAIQVAVDHNRTACLPARIKLTAEQIATFPRISAERQRFQPDMTMFGYPVDLVDTVEESTPYLGAQPGGLIEFHGKLSDDEAGRLRATFRQAYLAPWPAPPLTEFDGPPTVRIEEPARPGWLARAIRRIHR